MQTYNEDMVDAHLAFGLGSAIGLWMIYRLLDAGVLRATEEVKVSQVRLDALNALDEVLAGTKVPTSLAPSC